MVRPRSFFAVVGALVVIALAAEPAGAAAQSARTMTRHRNMRLFAMRPLRAWDMLRLYGFRQPVRPPMPSTTSSSSSTVDGTLSSIRQQILSLVNQERSKAGLPALTEESHLDAAAQGHAEDMNTQGYFAHDSLDGHTPTDRIRAAGYPLQDGWATGENIAKGQQSAQEVMNDWMHSPDHRENILNTMFTDIGIGYVNFVWVQDFAKP